MPQGELTIDRFPTVCFAPPLTDDLLAEYRVLVEKFNPKDLDPSVLPDALVVGKNTYSINSEEWKSHAHQLYDALSGLLKCVDKWWELPESGRSDGERFKVRHKLQKGGDLQEITVHFKPLEKAHQEELFDLIPWARELDTLSNSEDTGILDTLPLGNVRNAAFHLLWHVRELCNDREPLTHDKLPT
jgi:hypothetical protein